MVSISRLYSGKVEPSESLRYHGNNRNLQNGSRMPVVVWNTTHRCNCSCRHCYASCTNTAKADELTHDEARSMIEDLAASGIPYLLFSGGEPLLREDLCELVAYADALHLKCGLSTNGMLISPKRAQELATAGLTYAGISIDGTEAHHDAMRQCPGSFRAAIAGADNCTAAGIRTGFRFTVTKENVSDVPALFRIADDHGVDRICIYHLVYSGRGDTIRALDLSLQEKRNLLDTIIDETARYCHNGNQKEVLTVDNHCDGIYLYKRMMSEGHPQADAVLRLLEAQGASGTGIGIGCISWDGTVYPDQFWRNHPLGSIREKPFSTIWSSGENTFLAALRSKKHYLEGRCASCAYLDICGGNFRSRAEAAYSSLWAPDPACYLTDSEIHTRP